MEPDNNQPQKSEKLADQSSDQLLAAWTVGNESAGQILVDRYLARLIALVRSRLAQRFGGRLDPEDIVFSAWRSFFFAAQRGTIAIEDDGGFWSLLATITLRKLSKAVKHHSAQRRSIDQQLPYSNDLAQLVAADATAEQAAIVEEELALILSQLSQDESQVLTLRLDGLTQIEIAQQVGKSERSIRRLLIRIQQRILQMAALEEIPTDQQPEPQHDPEAPAFTEPVDPSLPRMSYGTFVLGKMIGQGGFGKVYRARFQQSDELVAVKFLKRKLWKDHRARAALMREVSIVSQLSDQGIIKHLGWGESPHGGLFIIMELIEGMNLAEWIEHAPRTDEQIMRVILEASRSIAVANDAGVIHCDLTPTNLLICNNGQVVVADFGMAAALTDNRSLELGGTAGFLAPEQFSSAFGSISQRTDVYGIGGLLYWCYTKSAPFSGESRETIIAQVLSNDPARLSAVSPKAPEEVVALMARCLSKQPANRPPLCELIELISKYAVGEC